MQILKYHLGGWGIPGRNSESNYVTNIWKNLTEETGGKVVSSVILEKSNSRLTKDRKRYA